MDGLGPVADSLAIDSDPALIDSEARPCGGRRDRVEASETGWRRARPCGGVVTVYIGLKPKGRNGNNFGALHLKVVPEQRAVPTQGRQRRLRRPPPSPRWVAPPAPPAEVENLQRHLRRTPQAPGRTAQPAQPPPLQRAVMPAEVPCDPTLLQNKVIYPIQECVNKQHIMVLKFDHATLQQGMLIR